MTDLEIEMEIERLRNSEAVKLAKYDKIQKQIDENLSKKGE